MSSTMSDPYMSSYYGTSYPFQTFGAMGHAKHYEDYYRDSMYGHDDRAGMKAVDQGMQ